MTRKHKSKALEEDCLCDKCPLRFQCFTQERIFSDSLFQGLFEAMIAQGVDRDQAISQIENEIRTRITLERNPVPTEDWTPNTTTWQPYTTWVDGSNTITTTNNTWTMLSDSVKASEPNDNGDIDISYTTTDGKEYNWCTNADDFSR